MARGTGPGGSLVAAAVLVAALALGSTQWRTTGNSGRGSGSAGVHPVLARLGVERVLVLRLPRVATRSEPLALDAARLGVPLEVLEATDGLQNETFRSRVLPLHAPEGTCADLIGAIFDTHERAWTLAASGHRPTLVLEDDVRLPPGFEESLAERTRALPKGYDLAFAGTSVTRQAQRVSRLYSRPDAGDANNQGLLGFWAYLVTPQGAQRLLRLVERERHGGRRFFQPVDLFVAHRLAQLEVLVLEPPEDLARDFELRPDPHHVLETMRQVGVVTLGDTPSTNQPAEDAETAEVRKHLDRVTQDGRAGKFLKSWRRARQALRAVRRFSCWNVAVLLQNAGLSLLRLLQERVDGLPDLGGPNGTLLAALEALGSSARYNEGTWMSRQKLHEFPEWVRNILRNREIMGFPPAAPPYGWDALVSLPGGGWLDARLPWLQEMLLLPNATDSSAAAKDRGGKSTTSTVSPTTTTGAQSQPPLYDRVGTFAGN